LLFHAQADDACYRIGEIVQRFLSCIPLRKTAGKVSTLSNPAAIERIFPDTNRDRPRRMMVVALALELVKDPPYD